MFEKIVQIFKKEQKKIATPVASSKSREAAKERLHLVLMQDRANVSADFLELMKQEIVDVIKKYIDIDEDAIDVRLTNKENDNGTNGAPALYANIPLVNVKVEEIDEIEANSKADKDNGDETEEVLEIVEEENKDMNSAENNNTNNVEQKNIDNEVNGNNIGLEDYIDNEKEEKNKNRKKKK